jgi:phosphatidylinositol alpha-1,6-mannosyltransferase
MKSLLLSKEYFPPQVGGISHMMANIAQALGPARVCCLVGVQSAADPIRDDPGRVHVYRRPRAFRGGKLTQGLALAAAMAEIWVREHPRAVQLSTLYETAVGRFLYRTLGLPYLVYAHGNEVLDATRSSWSAPLMGLRAAAAVVANSRFTADLVRKAGVEPDRIHIVHPGCDLQRYAPLSPSPELRHRLLGGRTDGPVILTVGNLVARKGHDNVIRALPMLPQKMHDTTYLIVGDGPQRRELEGLAIECGVRERVIFAGRIPEQELPACYALCDVFAMPSREDLSRGDVEGFGIVYIEANACQKPVVAGRSGGIPDAVVDGQTGLLVDPTDPGSIADALQRVLADSAFAAELGRQGRERAVRCFAWSGIAAQIQAILEDLAPQV